jgi:hypothetical protein
MRKYLKFAVASLAIMVVLVVSASAQVTGGAITGSVVDQNGAVVRGATVVLKDKARGQEFTTQTTDAGSYQFPNVQTGDYTLTVTANGFAPTNRELVVSLNQTTTVDVALAVSGSTAVVDVVAGGEAIVQSDSSQIGTTFKGRAAQDLPINGNANNLALLAPNVIPPANGTAGSGGVSGGIRARGNTFNVDGVDNNDASVTGPATAPIQDAVQEFTLLQNNFSAEFGAGAGGQFNQITKSGTNDYHGNIFTYIGSQALNSRSTDEDGTDKNYFKEVRYGGTLGGPLPYPHFGEGGPRFYSGKNKLFFFTAYEKYFQEGQGSSGSYSAPTEAGLNQIASIPGASSYLVNLLRTYVTLPTTSSFTMSVLGVPNVPFGDVFLPIPASQEQKSFQFNVDHLPNEKNQFRYRYARSRYSAEQAGNGGLAFNNFVTYNTDIFSANWLHTFNSSVVNDIRLSYFRTIQDFPLANPEVANFPNMTILNINLGIGPAGNLPQSGYDNNYQLYDAITWVTGSHTLKFGADYRRYLGGSDFLPRSRGDYWWSSFDLFIQDLRPDNVNIRGVGSGRFVSNNHRFFGFAQDDWKVRPNLTLNLGIRYEYQGLYRDAALQATAAPANVPGVIEFGVPETDKNNWAPRLGFAWAPNWDNMVGRLLFGEQGQSSIRANWGRSFFPNFSNFALISLPPTLQAELNGQGFGPATSFVQSGGIPSAFTPNLSPTFLRANAGSLILPQIVPYADSLAVSYQRQIGEANALEVRYLRTNAKQLPVQSQLNSRTVVDAAMVLPTFTAAPSASELAALPTIGTVVANNPSISPTTFLAPRQLGSLGFNGVLTGYLPIGESRYNGLAISFNRRFAKNLGFTTAYTWSKTEDNSTNELNTSALNPRRPQDIGEYYGAGANIDAEWGPSVLDIPHRFVTSWAYDVPFFNNSSNAFLKAALGGWQVNGIFQIQSGQPITPQAGRDANRNGDAAGDRALFNPNGDPNVGSGIVGLTLVNGVVTQVPVGGTPDPNVRAYLATNPNAGWISTGYFARELANGGAGTAIRNAIRTQGFNSTDMTVIKNTRFGKDARFNFQIGAEIFDLFNQRVRTINGVGAFTQAFALPANANFLNYDIGSFNGRTIRMRAKFIF